MLKWGTKYFIGAICIDKTFKKKFSVYKGNTQLTLIEQKKCPGSIKRTKGTLYAEECAIMTFVFLLKSKCISITSLPHMLFWGKVNFLYIFFSLAKTDINK